MGRGGLRIKAVALACGAAGAAGAGILDEAMKMLKSLPNYPEHPLFQIPVIVEFKPGCLTPEDDSCAKSVLDSFSADGTCGEGQLYPYLGMGSMTCTSTTTTSVVRAFRADPNIQSVSADNKWTLKLPALDPLLPGSTTGQSGGDDATVAVGSDTTLLSAANSVAAPVGGAYNWGRDRINQRNRNIFARPDPACDKQGCDKKMSTCPNGGAGVTIYLLDTGCSPNHQEFGGRATSESFKDANDVPFLPNGQDLYGHGSHTACLAGGSTVGIAWAAKVRCLKVLGDDGSGSSTWSVMAMEQVLREKKRQGLTKVVVNMSLGGVSNSALQAGVATLTANGIIVVAAAGNSAVDAANTSPGNAPSAITVGATDQSDNLSYFSNFGWGLDVLAPGSAILSCYNDGPNRYAQMSGTSMASPIVAGMVACIMSSSTKLCSTPDQYVQKLYSDLSSTTVFVNAKGVLKPLAYLNPSKMATCDTATLGTLAWWGK